MNKKEAQRSVSKWGKRNKSKEDILKDRVDEIFNIGREITDTEKTKPDKSYERKDHFESTKTRILSSSLPILLLSLFQIASSPLHRG